MPITRSTDGNQAAAHVAYALSEVCFLFPITPATQMGELADLWSDQGRPNIFGQPVSLTAMQSETGAAGAVHGAACVGSLVSTFTSSQGLLLMIPDLYKISGELLPSVFHVSSRAVGSQALTIYVDHMDVMATRSTGVAIMNSQSVQECADLALISHLSSIRGSLPFLHFFDGFRTSHEIMKIQLPTDDEIRSMVPYDCVQQFRDRALNPTHPVLRGTIEQSDVFFQCQESSQKYYNAIPAIVEQVMADFKVKFGREYHCFSYVGAPDAELVIALMGSGSQTIEEALPCLLAQGMKVGCIKVHLFRPWSAEHFIAAVPKTCRRIAVLDRTKEFGSSGEPLYLDVLCSFANRPGSPIIIGGRYGVGGKEFTPACVKAVFDNLAAETPKNHFTVNIFDDVCNSSITIGPEFDAIPTGTSQCMFWGLGADGTVGANHDAIKIIGDNTPLYVQGYFAYDAHKSGGLTISHLRFGQKPIQSQYLILNADYIACHCTPYVGKYRLLKNIKNGGIFVLNSSWKTTDMEAVLPGQLKRDIAQKRVRFYNIDASSIAESVGLGRRINTVMQAVFFQLSGVLPFEEAVGLLKAAVTKTYKIKGDAVVDMNIKAIQAAREALIEIPVPASWATAPIEPPPKIPGATAFVNDLLQPCTLLEGDSLPVSKFEPGANNPLGLTKFEKRGVAIQVPIWNKDKCTQCCECSSMCPHAAIRPFLLTEEEAAAAPFQTIKGKAKSAPHLFRIQVSSLDCTGCEVCTHACKFGALKMAPLVTVPHEAANWDYAIKLPNRGHLWPRNTIMGSQFSQPLLEFSGCCEGCSETAYVKLITQIMGERMLIANASGCSSVWGGTWGMIPYTTNSDGFGPAWANSLYEDNAEFGFGMAKANTVRRARLLSLVKAVLASTEPLVKDDLRAALADWVATFDKADQSVAHHKKIAPMLQRDNCGASPNINVREMFNNRDMFVKISHWIVGGDGWAYDINYGGLDHVIAQGHDVNVLVLDTEMYSNTGGQKSKATNLGAIAKFASGGCQRNKKDLGLMAMSYGDIFVASISMQANPHHAIRAMMEAEAYPGTSVILAYAPCKEHGFPMSGAIEESKLAIETGYWPLYRYDPRKSPAMQMDSKVTTTNVEQLRRFLMNENRFAALTRSAPATAERLHAALAENKAKGLENLARMASVNRLQAGLATTTATPTPTTDAKSS
ncbi:pyruvate:ferredoxin oxidoreductase [Pelomyxa schiedti]|nr:pyruvate:ferredoxin oxidoreductase [Pelomyxa schiedti]